MVVIGDGELPAGWTLSHTFYAFDFPVKGTCKYSVVHCVPPLEDSSSDSSAFQSRDKLTTSLYERNWDIRFSFYVFPAGIDDCSKCFVTEES